MGELAKPEDITRLNAGGPDTAATFAHGSIEDDPDRNLRDGWDDFKSQLRSLNKETPGVLFLIFPSLPDPHTVALWIVLLIKALESYAYFSISYILKVGGLDLEKL